jgi:hypothetical protein
MLWQYSLRPAEGATRGKWLSLSNMKREEREGNATMVTCGLTGCQSLDWELDLM